MEKASSDSNHGRLGTVPSSYFYNIAESSCPPDLPIMECMVIQIIFRNLFHVCSLSYPHQPHLTPGVWILLMWSVRYPLRIRNHCVYTVLCIVNPDKFNPSCGYRKTPEISQTSARQAYGSISPCPDSGGFIPLFHLPSPSMPYSPPVLRKQIHTLLLIIVSEGCFLCRSLPIRMKDSPTDPFYPPPDVFRNTPALLQITGSQLSIYCE